MFRDGFRHHRAPLCRSCSSCSFAPMARAGFSVASMTDAEQDRNSGSGSSLPVAVLLVAGISTVIAVLVSAMSIYLHLKNYLKPSLQR